LNKLSIKNESLIKKINYFAYLILAISVILTALWIFSPKGNYEPYIVFLGNFSAILLVITQYMSKQNDFSENMTLEKIIKIVSESIKEDWNVKSDDNSDFAYFKKNPLIRIVSNHNTNLINSNFHENWVDNFLDKTASMWHYELFYSDSKLETYYLISVDGARGLLPLPKSSKDLKVKPIQYKIAKIFDRFDKLDFYLGQAGISIEE